MENERCYGRKCYNSAYNASAIRPSQHMEFRHVKLNFQQMEFRHVKLNFQQTEIQQLQLLEPIQHNSHS